MQDRLKVAAISVDTKPQQLQKNLDKINTWTEKAASQGAELIMFQELSLTGFLPNHPVGNHDQWLREALKIGRDSALTLPGTIADQLTKIAQKTGTWISVGLLEDAGNLMYNTQVLVGPEGLAGRWRKMHIPMYEMPFYNGGGVPEVVETPLGRIGCNICFDSLIPESTRLLAVQNAEIVLFPFAADPPPRTPAGWDSWASTALKARCIENGVYGVAANYVGEVECAGATQNFPGGGLIVGPRGEKLSTWEHPADTPEMVLAELTSEQLKESRAEPEYLYRFRRPELYRSLCDESKI